MAVRAVGCAHDAVGSPGRGRLLAGAPGLVSRGNGMASGKSGWEPLLSASLSQAGSPGAGSRGLGWVLAGTCCMAMESGSLCGVGVEGMFCCKACSAVGHVLWCRLPSAHLVGVEVVV